MSILTTVLNDLIAECIVDDPSGGKMFKTNSASNYKASVRASSTPASGNVTLSDPNITTLDGVTLASGDRILLKDQTAGAENGIYIYAGQHGALVRSSDANTATLVLQMIVPIQEGTVNADSMWVNTTNAPITLGTTALTFAITSAISYTGDETSIHLSGTTFSIKTTWAGQAAITTVGTLTSGATGAGFTVALGTSTITGTLAGANGGTGVANTGKTITVSGNTTIGSSTHTVAFATSGNTSVTLPTSGTLATTSQLPTTAGLLTLGVALDATLRNVTDYAGTASPLNISTAQVSISAPGADSISPLYFTGALLTGGSGTTNFPHLFFQPTGTTAATNWSTTGTFFGVNAATGFTGNFFDFKLAGSSTSKAMIDYTGLLTCIGVQSSGSIQVQMANGAYKVRSDGGSFQLLKSSNGALYGAFADGSYAGSGTATDTVIYGTAATKIFSNSVLAVTVDTSQNLTFAGTKIAMALLQNRAAAASGEIYADTIGNIGSDKQLALKP